MDYASLLIQLMGGVAGSALAASRLKRLSQGFVGNVVTGLVGGALGGQILGSAFGTARLVASTGHDPGLVISELAAAGIGGAVLMALVGVLQRALAR